MSNYEDLMKKILLEAIEKEKLEEKVLAKFNTASNPVSSSSDLQNDDNMEKSRKYFNKQARLFRNLDGGIDKQNDWIMKALDVSQIADNPYQLDIKDLLKPFVTGDTVKQAQVNDVINQIDGNRKLDSKSKVGKAKSYIQGLRDSINAIVSSSNPQATYNAIIADFAGSVETPEGAGLDPFAVPQIASQVQSSATFNTDPNTNKRDFNNFTGNVQTAPGIAALFEAVDGNSLTEKLGTLFQFGENIKDKEEIDKYLATIEGKPQESFKFMNLAAAYLALIDLGKQYDGVSAGLAFEKYLAVLLNAPVIGGSNGAADNIAKTTRGSIVYLSAKSYQAGSFDTIAQSITGPEGLANLIGPGLNADGTPGSSVQNKGKSVFYITLGKKRKETSEIADMQYNMIDLYLTRVYYDFGLNQYYSEYLAADGNTITAYARHQTVIKDSKAYLYKASKDNLIPTYVLQAPTGDAEDMEMTRKFLVDQTESITNTVIKAIKQAYTNSQKIEDGVRGYTAKKSSGSDAVDFVKQLKESYKELFSNLSNMFAEGSKVTGAGDEEKKQASDFTKSKVDIKESNQIVDIIREMVENELKNIDFE